MKHVCDRCMRKFMSDEAYEIHMLTHAIERLADSIDYYITMREERKI